MRPRILVTGASGLIGRHVLDVLDGEAEVFAVSRVPPADDGRHEWLAADLSNPGSTEGVISSVRPTAIIHLAGEVRGERTLEAVAPTLRTNLVATVELLEAATRLGCSRIVLSGSMLEEPATSDSRVVPPSPYGASRWAASAYGRMFHKLFGAPVVILRPSFAYGPGQERTKLIPHVITALLEGRSPELSSGERLLDCVYATDAACAYVEALTAPGVEGQTLDVGSGDLTSVRAIVEGIVAAVGSTDGEPVFGRLAVRPMEQELTADVERTARTLGWRATTDLNDGLAATVAWFRDQVRSRPAARSL
jgi:UDP-glucose 4-epimerase